MSRRGPLTSQSMLHENENNYLAAVYAEEQAMAVAYCDISTGELYLTEYQGLDIYPTLLNELVKIKAKEIILNEDFPLRYSVEEVKQIDRSVSSTFFQKVIIPKKRAWRQSKRSSVRFL